MAGEDRDPYTGAAHCQVGDVQDLAGLVTQLLFFVGFERAVIYQRSGKRDGVIGDRFYECFMWTEVNTAPVGGEATRIATLGDLIGQFLRTDEPGP